MTMSPLGLGSVLPLFLSAKAAVQIVVQQMVLRLEEKSRPALYLAVGSSWKGCPVPLPFLLGFRATTLER